MPGVFWSPYLFKEIAGARSVEGLPGRDQRAEIQAKCCWSPYTWVAGKTRDYVVSQSARASRQLGGEGGWGQQDIVH